MRAGGGVRPLVAVDVVDLRAHNFSAHSPQSESGIGAVNRLGASTLNLGPHPSIRCRDRATTIVLAAKVRQRNLVHSMPECALQNRLANLQGSSPLPKEDMQCNLCPERSVQTVMP